MKSASHPHWFRSCFSFAHETSQIRTDLCLSYLLLERRPSVADGACGPRWLLAGVGDRRRTGPSTRFRCRSTPPRCLAARQLLRTSRRTHKGAVRKFAQIDLDPAHLPPLPGSPAPPALLASACSRVGCCLVFQRKDTMSASASSLPAGEENKQEAAPVRHCKGINDLNKVMLLEVRGSSRSVDCAC